MKMVTYYCYLNYGDKEMDKVTGRLENWHVGMYEYDGEVMIWGDVYDDVNGRFMDGTYIHTSGIKPQEFNEGDVVTTRNSTYLLGKKFELPEGMVMQ